MKKSELIDTLGLGTVERLAHCGQVAIDVLKLDEDNDAPDDVLQALARIRGENERYDLSLRHMTEAFTDAQSRNIQYEAKLTSAKRIIKQLKKAREDEKANHISLEHVQDEDMSKLRKELRELKAIISADNLRLLADWFDKEQAAGRWDGANGSFEVQTDLRRLADAVAKE